MPSLWPSSTLSRLRTRTGIRSSCRNDATGAKSMGTTTHAIASSAAQDSPGSSQLPSSTETARLSGSAITMSRTAGPAMPPKKPPRTCVA